MQVTPDQIRRARTAELFSYLKEHHLNAVRKTGKQMYLEADHSVCVHRGSPGFHDFETDARGNSVDFLTTFMGYSFTEAVSALSGPSYRDPSPDIQRQTAAVSDSGKLRLPCPSDIPRQAYAYLQSRGIPADVITKLIGMGVLYQEAGHNNLVFLSPGKDCFEQRGTFTYSRRPFRQNQRLSPESCWFFTPDGSGADRVYICEGAIDAVSLYVLHKKAGIKTDHMYASLGGVCNQRPIDRFIKEGMEVVIAVDNDDAGEACRLRNSRLRSVIPKNKDWNEDLAMGAFRKYYK